MIIINHFTAFPLISYKSVEFVLWSEAVKLINTCQHLVPSTFNYILSISAALGRGPSKAVMEAFPSLTPVVLPAYNLPVSSLNPWWISGYLTLYCSFALKIDAAGWGESVYNKFRHPFYFSFDSKNLPLANAIGAYLSLSVYVRGSGERVDVMAQSTAEAESVIDFFDVYPLQSYKNDQYEVWRKFVMSISVDRDLDVQRKRSFTSDRFDFYNKLVTKFYTLTR